MNEIKEKIMNSKEISQGKSFKGSEVDKKTNEIESFAKSIAHKYETTKIEETTKNEETSEIEKTTKTDETTDFIETTDADDIPKFILNGFNLIFKNSILFLFIFILL